MRNKILFLICALLCAAPCFPQSESASVNVQATRYPYDTRPFGKYLEEICSLSGPDSGQEEGTEGQIRTLSCERVRPGRNERNFPIEPRKTDQAISLKLVCDPKAKGPCDLQPLVVGKDFFVSATSDSGRTVRQMVLSGNATPVGGNATVQYRANSSGVIIIRATRDGDAQFKQAPPVDLILPVLATAKKVPTPCSVLPASPPTTTTQLDAPTIVSLLGNPTPFVLVAQGPNTIAIYSTREPLINQEPKILGSFHNAITLLAGRTAASLAITATGKPFTVELKIPHGAALGDLATRVNGLNYSQFTIQDVARERVRVTSPTQPDCDTWTNFLEDIRLMAWQLISQPFVRKLSYLSSSDVATAFSALPAPTAPATSPAPSPAAAPPPSGTSNSTISIAQPPGSNIQISSDTTPCVVAGLAFGNANACVSPAATAPGSAASSSAPATPSATPAPQAPPGMASVAVAIGANEQTPPDLLVFSDPNPGDDAQIQERLRIIAQLDLPRPEMIINAWVTQNSTSSPQATGAFTNLVKGIVADYNQQFENVVLRGWESVKAQSQDPAYWNEAFRSYIEDRFVSDGAQEEAGTSSAQQMSQAFLDTSRAKLAYPIPSDKLRDPKICPRGRYCLGYNSLFHPLRPALTDLLLTIIAARYPAHVADVAIAAIEKGSGEGSATDEAPLNGKTEDQVCDDKDTEEIGSDDMGGDSRRAEVHRRCHAIWRNLDLDHVTAAPSTRRTCMDRDYRGTLHSLLYDEGNEPRIHLQCFKEEVHRLLAASADGHSYGAGQLRSAVADFLYNYKLSQQYTHEFGPYDLNHTADALNTALTPLIDAFNRDITTYQLFVRADMQYQVEQLNARRDGRCCVKWLFGLDKPSFFNDGLITVRTISGQATTVNTTSQSSLNVGTAPELTTLLSSLTASSPASSPPPASKPASTSGNASSGSTSSGSSGGSNPPAEPSGLGAGSLASTIFGASTLGKVTALAGLLGNYQTTFAQIGRSLNIAALPRSLNTASSAEITVTLNADESSSPSFFNVSGAATDPALNISRVASHDTTTRVRIESVKLFEISSLTAVLERSRSRFPLLPPFVEIPYIGTLAGIPLGAAKEFHNSTAILSAYVVPTAADIAFGLRFVPDLVVDALNQGRCGFYKAPGAPNACIFRKALSLHDFGYRSLNNFNLAMVRCFANDKPSSECQSISLDDVPSMY